MFQHRTPGLGTWLARLFAPKAAAKRAVVPIAADVRALSAHVAATYTVRQMTYPVGHFMGLNR
jgi:hypothetical protein